AIEGDPTSQSALQGIAAVRKQRWASLTLADALAAQGYSDQALLLYDQILRKRDRDFPVEEAWRARLGKAWCLYNQGDYSEAKVQFENVLQERENEATALQGLGYTYYQKQNYPACRTELEKALRLYPDWFAVVDNLGWCELKMQNYGRAIAYFKEAIRLSPTTADSHAGAAWVRQKGGRTDQAMEHFRNAIALDPRYVETDEFRILLTKERVYRKLLLPLGEAYIAQGEYETAISRLRRALFGENSLRVRANLGYAQLQIGSYKDAISTLRVLPEAMPKTKVEIWKNATWSLGWAHYYEGDYSKAADIFRRINSETEIGWCLLRLGNVDEAEQIFQNALVESPQNTLATNGLVEVKTERRSILDKGWEEYYAQRYRKAESLFQKALSEKISTELVWEVRLGLGWCHIKSERLDDAMKELDEARYEALNAEDPITARATVHIPVGWVNLGKGNHTSALEAFGKAQETLPGHIDIYRGLGWTYYQMKQKENALQAFERGLKIYPRDPSCSEGIALLQPRPMDK
ncbi:MAG: tetratricopeptide repeat protein, partial [Planctomycetota bacterium]|nr:tetratricopeptide repeat protein [Planctomycetota bacterium]